MEKNRVRTQSLSHSCSYSLTQLFRIIWFRHFSITYGLNKKYENVEPVAVFMAVDECSDETDGKTDRNNTDRYSNSWVWNTYTQISHEKV